MARVVVELPDGSAVEAPTFRKKGFPFTFFVLAPIPPDVVPRAVASFDDQGRPLGRATDYSGYPGGCR